MDINSFVLGIAASLVAMALWVYGGKKRKGYYKQKIEDLEYEKERIEAITKKPTELYRDSFKNLFSLIFIISFANIIRLLHGLLYDNGVVWQQVFTEGGLWFVASSLALRYKKRIDSTYTKSESISIIEQKIKSIKQNANKTN